MPCCFEPSYYKQFVAPHESGQLGLATLNVEPPIITMFSPRNYHDWEARVLALKPPGSMRVLTLGTVFWLASLREHVFLASVAYLCLDQAVDFSPGRGEWLPGKPNKKSSLGTAALFDTSSPAIVREVADASGQRPSLCLPLPMTVPASSRMMLWCAEDQFREIAS